MISCPLAPVLQGQRDWASGVGHWALAIPAQTGGAKGTLCAIAVPPDLI
ncbi:MAG: hypothetical protein KME26_22445 [Oscillatoria princeps RMCB-10]|nr:hypothetical protein [Oscillatoria princeps RMCB-10]